MCKSKLDAAENYLFQILSLFFFIFSLSWAYCLLHEVRSWLDIDPANWDKKSEESDWRIEVLAVTTSGVKL